MTTNTGASADVAQDEEILLEPEAVKKLNQIITNAKSGTDNGWENLPDELKPFVESVTIDTNLRENLPDRLAIEITFCLKFNSPSFSATMMPRKVFYVDCLSENIKTLVEEKFKETTINFLQEFCNSLYVLADTLHELFNP